MHATLESESAVIAIAKPGSLANPLTLIVDVQGEAELNVTFHVTMTEVTVQTRVEALVSCNNTVAFVTSAGLKLESQSFKAESPIEVRPSARDVDSLEVRFTRAEIELLWEDENQQGTKFLFNTEAARANTPRQSARRRRGSRGGTRCPFELPIRTAGAAIFLATRSRPLPTRLSSSSALPSLAWCW